MADDRKTILDQLGASLSQLTERTPYPQFAADAATPDTLRGRGPVLFAERLTKANTVVVDTPQALGDFLARRDAKIGYCDPELASSLRPWLGADVELDLEFDRERVNEYAFGITRATSGVIETGSLILTDRDTSNRLGALAPWIHIACLDPAALHLTLADAITGLGDDPNVVFVTGHSQTADVEGILIQGVHGPGEQVCLLYDLALPEGPGDPDQ
jgi:L-lactate dehydrogenase complex protein LldG